MARRLADPLTFAAAVLLVIVAFLAWDSGAGAHAQLLIGAATWAILLTACVPLSPEERTGLLLVVVVATCVEVLGSILIGAYVYRLGNLPAFVPPGTDSYIWPGFGSASRMWCDEGRTPSWRPRSRS